MKYEQRKQNKSQSQNGDSAKPGKNGQKPFEVYTINERGEKNFWVRIGAAFKNRDGSLNVLLDALPINGSLNIRAPKEEQYGCRRALAWAKFGILKQVVVYPILRS